MSIVKRATSPLSALTKDQRLPRQPFVFLSEFSNNRNGCGNKLPTVCHRERSAAFKSYKEPTPPITALRGFYF